MASKSRAEISRAAWRKRKREGGRGTCAYCLRKIYAGGSLYMGRLLHETCAKMYKAGIPAHVVRNPKAVSERRPPREWFVRIMPYVIAQYRSMRDIAPEFRDTTLARARARIAAGAWWKMTPAQREAFRKRRELPSGIIRNPLMPGERYLGATKWGVPTEEAKRRGWLNPRAKCPKCGKFMNMIKRYDTPPTYYCVRCRKSFLAEKTEEFNPRLKQSNLRGECPRCGWVNSIPSRSASLRCRRCGASLRVAR